MAIFFYSQITNWYSKNSGRKLVQRCREDYSYARKVANSLSFLYEKQNLNDNFHRQIGTICDEFRLDESRIRLFLKVEPHTYLLITHFPDGNPGMHNANRAFDRQLHFKLLVNDRNEVKLYSDPSSSEEDKNLKEVFAGKLFRYLLQ
jgi:hypothetical protein